jgi:uncharacterized protein (TIGR02145 family)
MKKLLLTLASLALLSTSLYAGCTADVEMDGNMVKGLGTPTDPDDATTKAYVDRGGAEVTAPAGYGVIYTKNKAWLDKNLGATSATNDANGYGDLYQWGRPADGHEDRSSGTTATLATEDAPGHANFITNGAAPYNWRNENRTHFWSGPGTSVNGVCPAGWRVPSEQDFADLDITSSTDAWNKIKLTRAGNRSSSSAALASVGANGYYWTSSVDGEYSRSLNIYSSGSNFFSGLRASGLSVRCMKHL